MNTQTSSNDTGYIVVKLTVFLGVLAVLPVILAAQRLIQDQRYEARTAVAAATDSVNYADCLWYVARNNGFYQVQREIAMDQNRSRNLQLWRQFVESLGQDACGPLPGSLEELSLAVAETVSVADQHFLQQ